MLLLGGGGTYLMPSVAGHMVHSETLDQRVAPYTARTDGARPYSGHTDKWHKIEYSYEVDGSKHKSQFIGLYAPINLDLSHLGEDGITVYYMPYFEGVSLIKRGVDWRVCVAILFFGASSLYAKKFFQV